MCALHGAGGPDYCPHVVWQGDLILLGTHDSAVSSREQCVAPLQGRNLKQWAPEVSFGETPTKGIKGPSVLFALIKSLEL